jgi:magnesium-transporting ATPase (P-type)
MATPAGDGPIRYRELEERANALAANGFRVLAIASGRADVDDKNLESLHPDQLTGLVFLGFVGMIDPLRPAGIRVAMVTGDHPVTALAIARELGFAERPEHVVTGPMLQRVAAQGEEAMDSLVRGARVFARVEPNQKLQIVESLIRQGHFVAVTGDGANDAPALRAAHIGVAMGARGTDVARESAELILTNDDFASIVAGVEEGRIAYANVRKVIYLLVSSGAAEVLLFVLATAADLPVPLLPAQLLWLNLVTNGIQDVALAFEPGEGKPLSRPPRPPSEPIFDRTMIERTVVSAVVIATVGFLAYQWMLERGWAVPLAQNGVLLLLVLFENIQAGNSRSETASLLSLSPFRNRLLFVGAAVAQLVHIAAMYTPGLRDVLHLSPVSLEQWFVSLSLALSLLCVSELHKVLLRRRASGEASAGTAMAPA